MTSRDVHQEEKPLREAQILAELGPPPGDARRGGEVGLGRAPIAEFQGAVARNAERAGMSRPGCAARERQDARLLILFEARGADRKAQEPLLAPGRRDDEGREQSQSLAQSSLRDRGGGGRPERPGPAPARRTCRDEIRVGLEVVGDAAGRGVAVRGIRGEQACDGRVGRIARIGSARGLLESRVDPVPHVPATRDGDEEGRHGPTRDPALGQHQHVVHPYPVLRLRPLPRRGRRVGPIRMCLRVDISHSRTCAECDRRPPQSALVSGPDVSGRPKERPFDVFGYGACAGTLAAVRRPTIRWTSAPDEADAAAAVAEIEAWLAARPEPPDWAGVLGPVREGLARLAALPALRADPQARAILIDLTTATEPEALDSALDALRRRADALSRAHRSAAAVGETGEADRGHRARTRLRL